MCFLLSTYAEKVHISVINMDCLLSHSTPHPTFSKSYKIKNIDPKSTLNLLHKYQLVL